MPEYPNPKLPPASLIEPPAEVARCPSGVEYAELDVTTNFSFLRGASHPDELVFTSAMLGQRAMAVTDVNSLAGVVRAYSAAKQVNNFKLIVGARLVLSDAPDLLVWATDRAAYGRLCRLLTDGKQRAEKGECTLSLEDFLERPDGLLAALTPETTAQPRQAAGAATKERSRGSGEGPGLGAQDSAADASGAALHPLNSPRCARGLPGTIDHALPLLREALGRDRFSLATSCLYGPDDESRLKELASLSQQFDVPLVATNHVHYHDAGRRALQDVLTCVRHGCTIRQAGYKLFPNAERHLKSPAQMGRLFSAHPRAVRRTVEIADRCRFSLKELQYEYPAEVVPPGRTPIEHLAELSWAGAAGRYPGGIPEKVRRQVSEELGLIETLKFEHYFLTVHDIVCHARSQGILCQGRGSAANSAVCYCLGVTSVDPNVHDLLFARFVSTARSEPPDIDVDFEHERREEVIQYVYKKYGRERSGMTATVISYRGRSAVRDVGKALGLSLDMVDSMAKRLDWWHRGTITDQQLRDSGIDPGDGTVRHLVGLTGELLGFPRHLSQHTGGMVMTRGPLSEMVPIENASMPDRTVIEWDKDDIDEVGILKVDILALGMLTALSRALKFLNGETTEDTEDTEESKGKKRGLICPPSSLCPLCPLWFNSSPGQETHPHPVRRGACPGVGEEARLPLELHTIPPEDTATYDMICDGDTVGVFQIESRAQMAMLPRLKPRSFYDLVIEVAIVRPGPIQGDMVHPYLRRRNGEEPVTYPSEQLREVLGNTLGVPLFQEQAMKVVMVAAGFSAADADRLRRAMAAWKKNGVLDTFHDKVVNGMLANGYTREFAEATFNQIRGFGLYGFPESHAASFALLVYASAWVKRHHPAAFCAALLNSQPMGFYAPAQLVRDARDHGVDVRPVDVNASEWDCSLEERHGGTEARRHGGEEGGKASWGMDGPAVRLGFRQVRGMKTEHVGRIVERRARDGRFRSVDHFHRATGLPVSALRRLAEADAFGSLGLSRRQALWQVLKLKDDDLPLFDDAPPSAPSPPSCLRAFVPSCLPSPNEPRVDLPAMPLGQEVMTDYSTAGLSLKRHPVAIVRDELSKQKVITAAELMDGGRSPHGRWVKVAGLVLIRQRPGTASGVVFVTLEDETGVANLILWPQVYEQYHAASRHATLLQCDGYVQRQGQVVHVLAKRLFDRSDLLSGYDLRSRDFH